MLLVTWRDVLVGSFQNLWYGVVNYVPVIVAAIVVALIGWVVAAFVGSAISKLIQAIKLDDVLRKAGLESVLSRGNFRLNSGKFIGGVIKWFIIIAFLVAAADMLGLSQVKDFLIQLLSYLPQVIIAAVILIAGAVFADIAKRLIIGSTAAAGVKSAKFIGSVARWAIWIFAILMALVQLGIAVQLIQTLFMGVVIAFALAFGLAFGFGGQQEAARLIEKTRQEISRE